MKKAFCFMVLWLLITLVSFSQTTNTQKKPISYPADLHIDISTLGFAENTGIERGYRGDLPIYSTRRILKGSVKTLKVKTFSGRIKFGVFQIESAEQFSTFLFDQKGFLIEKNNYASDSSFIDQSIYKYDNNGNHTETINTFSETLKFENSYDRPVSRTNNIYNDKGYQIESNSYNLDGSLSYKSIFKLDSNNKLIEKNDYTSVGDLLSKSVYKYDAKGKLNTTIISDREIKSDVNLFADRIKCLYNGKGDLIELQYQYWPRQDVFFKYDEMGNLIQEMSTSPWPNFKIIYKYEYDSKGNWIKKNKFEYDNQTDYTQNVYIQTDYTEREIEYY